MDHRRVGRHERQERVERRELRVAIDPHRVVGVGADEVALEAAGGVEDEELDARPPRADRGDEPVERRGIRDVGSDGERGAARPLHLGRDLAGARTLVPVRERDIEASSGELARGRGTDPARTARDDGHAARGHQRPGVSASVSCE